MKLSWKLISAFYFPLHFAFGCFYISSLVLGEKEDCRTPCAFSMSCADNNTLLLLDLFGYTGIGLIILSLALPAITSYNEKKIIQTSIFK